jgi:hypothetical protein
VRRACPAARRGAGSRSRHRTGPRRTGSRCWSRSSRSQPRTPRRSPQPRRPAPRAGCCSSANPGSGGWRSSPASVWSSSTTRASASAPPST